MKPFFTWLCARRFSRLEFYTAFVAGAGIVTLGIPYTFTIIMGAVILRIIGGIYVDA